jgi:hypothetical protein
VNAGVTYLLPIRSRPGDGNVEALTGYLRWLSERADLVIVDGSDPAIFDDHHRAWATFSTHRPPDSDLRCANGKVHGLLTGLRLARHERVVIADEDIRYDEGGLRAMAEGLARAELVRPQNYFDPLPWHARWDTARILLNRAFGGDYPGTLGVRRSFLRSIGGYDGDVLFENLELMRTVEAAGGRILYAPTLFVRREPPTVRRFLEQRPRQAYDDWAQPMRFAAFLLLGPAVAALAWRRPRALVLAGGGAILAAGAGRLRAGGAAVFDRASPLLAPLWVCERAFLAWQALGRRLLGGGCPYAGSVIGRAANPPRLLRRRLRSRSSG